MKRLALLLVLGACAAPTEPRSPIPGAVEFAAGAREAAAYAGAQACVTAQGAALLRDAPAFAAVRWYGVNARTFLFRSGLSSIELEGVALGGTVTIALGASDIMALETHEVLHLLIGDPGHTRAGLWAGCGLLRGMETTSVTP